MTSFRNRFRHGGSRGLLPAALILLSIAGQAGAPRAQENTMSIDPAVSTPLDSVFVLSVVRNAGDDVCGFDVAIAFDPALVSLVAIEPGEWVTMAGLPYFFHDATQDGTDAIEFTMAFLGQVASPLAGEVARCRFRAKQVGISPLTFIVIQARDAENNPIPFSHSTGDQIIIQEAVGAEAFSLGRVKALYR